MEARKWEELPIDCLVEVLGRVGVGSLLVDVPLVCKSWYKATLTPFCWKELHFPSINPFQGKISMTKFLKVVVDRSAGCATMVKLPFCYTEEALTYVADKCPAVKKLVLHSEKSSSMWALLFVIGKFKNLESLEMNSCKLFREIVPKIGAHCQNFVALSLVSVSNAWIGKDEVMAIVSCLPKIKCLTLRDVTLKREHLIKILHGCVELVHLDVCGCCGFLEDDEELSKLASHIPTFECSGSYSADLLGDFYHDFDDYDYC